MLVRSFPTVLHVPFFPLIFLYRGRVHCSLIQWPIFHRSASHPEGTHRPKHWGGIPDTQHWWHHSVQRPEPWWHWRFCVTGREGRLRGVQVRIWCFFSFFFFFCVSSYISVVHQFWMRFLCMWLVFYTILVVTFHSHGWCMLGVFLLLAFTHLGLEHQDLLSLCCGMHVCIDKTSVCTLIRKSVRGTGIRTHVNS